jgi:hypothetical protein
MIAQAFTCRCAGQNAAYRPAWETTLTRQLSVDTRRNFDSGVKHLNFLKSCPLFPGASFYWLQDTLAVQEARSADFEKENRRD